MYSGFFLKLGDDFDPKNSESFFNSLFPQNNNFYGYNYWLEKGKSYFEETSKMIRNEFQERLLKDDKIDATSLKEEWFPDIKADVFLSHSHKDVDFSIALAAYLKQVFGLETFIDSCFWGYSDDLLKELLDRYCLKRELNGNVYSYNESFFIASNIYMMLSLALTKMIDKTECLLFLKSSNSISIEEDIKEKTSSPWIFSEIEISRMIRRKRHRKSTKLFSKGGPINESIEVERKDFSFDLDSSHLNCLSKSDFEEWVTQFRINSGDRNENVHALDTLYEIKGLHRRSTLQYITE